MAGVGGRLQPDAAPLLHLLPPSPPACCAYLSPLPPGRLLPCGHQATHQWLSMLLVRLVLCCSLVVVRWGYGGPISRPITIKRSAPFYGLLCLSFECVALVGFPCSGVCGSLPFLLLSPWGIMAIVGFYSRILLPCFPGGFAYF